MTAGLRGRPQHILTEIMLKPWLVVILLSFVLALGFLLIILSCALWANWLPLLVGACVDCNCMSMLSLLQR